MKKISPVKVIGLIGAVVLIVFGSLENIVRTLALAWNKLSRR